MWRRPRWPRASTASRVTASGGSAATWAARRRRARRRAQRRPRCRRAARRARVCVEPRFGVVVVAVQDHATADAVQTVFFASASGSRRSRSAAGWPTSSTSARPSRRRSPACAPSPTSPPSSGARPSSPRHGPAALLRGVARGGGRRPARRAGAPPAMCSGDAVLVTLERARLARAVAQAGRLAGASSTTAGARRRRPQRLRRFVR